MITFFAERILHIYVVVQSIGFALCTALVGPCLAQQFLIVGGAVYTYIGTTALSSALCRTLTCTNMKTRRDASKGKDNKSFQIYSL